MTIPELNASIYQLLNPPPPYADLRSEVAQQMHARHARIFDAYGVPDYTGDHYWPDLLRELPFPCLFKASNDMWFCDLIEASDLDNPDWNGSPTPGEAVACTYLLYLMQKVERSTEAVPQEVRSTDRS